MAFHDVQFPTTISYQSMGGPGFNTSSIETDSGAVRRNARWGQMRHGYDAKHAVKSWDALYALKTFFAARFGPLHSFRYKDWQDWSTSANGRDAPTDTDQIIGVGDGTTVTFKLRKTYVSGSNSIVRLITKPVAGTTIISLAGVSQPSGWSVNTSTGDVTFSVAPSPGANVGAGCRFDVPVQFDMSLDKMMAATLEDFESGRIDSVPMNEVFDEDYFPDDYYYGGSSVQAFAADITLSLSMGRSIALQPASALNVYLPDNTSLPGGGPYFFLFNGGAFTYTLKKHDGTTIRTCAAASAVIVWLGVDQTTGTRTWYA